MVVLYHAANASCFVKCLLHRCLYHPNDEAVFIGYAHLSSEFFKPDKYKTYLEYKPMLGPFGTYNQRNAKSVIKEITEFFDKLLDECDLKISDFEKIYLGSYYSEFAMYVNIKREKHSIFEEAAGDWKPLEWDGFETFNAIIKQLDMKYFNNALVEHRYGILSVWLPEHRSDKDVNFEPYKEIYHLNEDDKKYFIENFHLPKLSFNNGRKTLLLLTQWFFKEGGGKWNDARIVTMYKMLLDYFVEDIEQYSVYIKPHPADPVQEEYEKIRDVQVISSRCISELLGLIEGINFELALTISSHSLYTINEFTKETRQIGYKMVSLYSLIHKYYFAFGCLYDFMLLKECYRFGVMDEEYEFLKGIPKINRKFDSKDVKWRSWESVGSSMVIIHRLYWREKQEKFVFDKNKIDENTVCVFLDVNELLNHATGDVSFIIENSIIFQLKKICQYTGLIEDESEYVYCFCKNIQIRNQLRMYTYTRSLKHEGIILKISALNEFEEAMNRNIQLLNRLKK